MKMETVLRFTDYLKDWLDLSLKLLGLATVVVAIWMIQESSVALRKESEISILDMETFLKEAASRLQITGIEKRFYDSLNGGKPFPRLSWVSHVADPEALSLCLSQIEHAKPIDVFSEESMEKFAETVAGYGKEDAVKELIERQQTCAHFTLFDLNRFLQMTYGTPFDLLIDFKKQGVTPQFYDDPIYQLIKSFENWVTRKVLFEELARHRKIITILKLENTGRLEARDVKVRFNFILAGVKTGEGLVLSGGQHVWQVLREPIYLEGGTLSESFPNSAEVFYPVVPAQSRKFIYVITHQNDIPAGTFHLEPIPYLSRIPHVSVWWFISICVISAILVALRKWCQINATDNQN